MSVYYLPASEGRNDPSSDTTARELLFLAGPQDCWLLPDDDAYDTAAVDLAANGVRQVRLTLAERLTAATRILTSGGSVHNVCVRLALPDGTEQKWRQLQRRFTSIVSAVVLLAVASSINQA